MPQERLITEKDLLKVAQYISGFDIIRIERHDKAGGFRFIIGLGSDQAKCMIEQDKSDNSWSFWALECPFWG